jgi:hypothetical protein
MILHDTPRPVRFRKFRTTSHLMSDLVGAAGTAELDRFACSIGLRVEWRQNTGTETEHYDLFDGAIARAVAAGSVEVPARELITRVVRPKRAARGVVVEGGCPKCARLHREDQGCIRGVVLVCGGRDYADRALLFRKLDLVACRVVITVVRHGACHLGGADQLADQWAAERGLERDPMPADFATHGRAGGPIRNAAMLAKTPGPVVCVAFRGGDGTRDMVSKREAARVPVWRVGWSS